MSALLVLGIVFVWITLSSVVLVSVSMMSSRLSRIEEASQHPPIIEVSGSRVPSGAPTQPRAEVLAK